MLNIFIEGIPGSGKSTLLDKLRTSLSSYQFYYEGDISPIELAWCSYMTPEQYNKALQDWPELVEYIRMNTKIEGNHFIVSYTRITTDVPDFFAYMERYELYGGRRSITEFRKIVLDRFHNFHGSGNIFECSFFQNILEELMLFAEYEDSQILDFYRNLISTISDDFLVIRLVTNDIEKSIHQIKKERINVQGKEVWYQLMMNYLAESPYGKAHHIHEFDDMLKHFQRRISLEKRIATELLVERFIDIESKNYCMEDILPLLQK